MTSMSGQAVVTGEYAGADSTIVLFLNDYVDIVKKSEKWWYVSTGKAKGYFPAVCLRELSLSEVSPLPHGWRRTTSSDNRKSLYRQEII